MFRALPCSSSEGLRRNCTYAVSGVVNLYKVSCLKLLYYNLYLYIPMCCYIQYKIIQSNTSLLMSDLRKGYMFRSQRPSSGLNINTP
jgi:hypothetical protein